MNKAEAGAQLCVDEGDISLFARFSHDRNPLHVDGNYARRTSFGTTVVHGMLGALRLLIFRYRDSPIRLTRLDLTFRGAIYPGGRHSIDWQNESESVFKCVLTRGAVPKLIMRGEWRAEPGFGRARPGAGTAPHQEPLDSRPAEGDSLTGVYRGDDSALTALNEGAGNSELPIPFSQADALGLVSYVAGMLLPGRQALLLGARLEFPGISPASDQALEFQARVGRVDNRFGRIWVNVEASRAGVVELRGSIDVGCRPVSEPFRFRPGKRAGDSTTAPSTAIVTGGTRGLGAHLVSALAERGAQTLATFRTGVTEAQELVAQLSDLTGRVQVFQGDLGDTVTADALRERSNQLVDLNLLILNATGPIRRVEMGELQDGELEIAVSHALRVALNPLRALLPRLAAQQGTVIFVSSVYAREAPEGFGHYVAAKCAVESLFRVFAKECATVRFMVVRPPRMKTDQTASVFSLDRLYDPADIAAWILDCIERTAATPGVVQEFDYAPQHAPSNPAADSR